MKRTARARATKGKAKRPTKPRAGAFGSGKPYRKATDDEVDRRVELVADMLARKATKIQIHDEFRERDREAKLVYVPDNPAHWFFDLHWRSVDRYIALARGELLRRAKKTKLDALLESVAYWEGVVRDEKATIPDRGYAQKQLDKIYGVHAPTQVRVTTPPGQPLEQKVAVADERPLRNLTTARLLEIAGMGEQRKESQ